MRLCERDDGEPAEASELGQEAQEQTVERVERAEGEREEEWARDEGQGEDTQEVKLPMYGLPEVCAEVGNRLAREVARGGNTIRRPQATIEADERVVRGRFQEDCPPTRTQHARRLTPDRRRIDIHQEILAVDEIDALIGQRERLGVGSQGRDNRP